MNYFKFICQSRTINILFKRLLSIAGRFGFTHGRFEKYLDEYINTLRPYNSYPTLAITAKILERHPRLIQKMNAKGVEFAIHGYLHKDHSRLSFEEQTHDLMKAKQVFKKNEIPFKGFRAPYLRYNQETLKAVGDGHFLWDSNLVINWDVLEKRDFKKSSWEAYEYVAELLYESKKADTILSLPRQKNGYVEIPLSIPDDEILTDRLCIHDAACIEKIWSKILKETYSRGELFTLQIHPERIKLFAPVLKSILSKASTMDPPVWITQVNEIAEWWIRKNSFCYEIIKISTSQYKIKVACPENAIVFVKNLNTDCSQRKFDQIYNYIDPKEFIVESNVKPIIGFANDSSPQLKQFLKEEGFLSAEIDKSDKTDCALFFHDKKDFSFEDEKELLHQIDSAQAPIIRIWRWPKPFKSALSVTGDIDSITLFDFFMRIFEF